MATSETPTDVEKVERLAKWLDFQLGEPVGNQVRDIAKRLAELEAENLRHRELYFAPTGDNHHNANLCPYCSPGGANLAAQLRVANREKEKLLDGVEATLEWFKEVNPYPEKNVDMFKEGREILEGCRP